MAQAIAFKSWLIQPGNHRQLTGIREKLYSILQRKVDIDSWPDLYRAFEESVGLSESNREVFEPVFEAYPPTEELGATDRQIRLYRGAQVNPDAIPSATAETVTVTYRGRVIEKRRDAEPEQRAEHSDGGGSKPRYYRGAKIN